VDIETKKTSINKSTVDDMLTNFLYSISYINDDDEVSNIKLGKVNKNGEMPLSFDVKKKQ
jgi:hypothetical protein